jgi:hypothetical protein
MERVMDQYILHCNHRAFATMRKAVLKAEIDGVDPGVEALRVMGIDRPPVSSLVKVVIDLPDTPDGVATLDPEPTKVFPLA